MTIRDSFLKLLSNLEPTPKQKERIQTHREQIDQALINDPKLYLRNPRQPSFLTGSYKRNTLIRPINDVDLYVVINYGKHAADEKSIVVMRHLRRILHNRFSQTSIRRDSPCVVLNYLDMKFEVVPVFGTEYDDERYGLPDDELTGWEYCYPNIPQKWLSQCNHINKSKFIPLIKILKRWNLQYKVRLKSFHLELLTGLVFDEITDVIDYPQAIYDWMHHVCRWMHENKTPFVPEPGKPDVFVDTYLYDKRLHLRMVRNKLFRGLQKAQQAYYHVLHGKELGAMSIYRDLFGRFFPQVPKLPAEKGKLVPPKSAPAKPLQGLNALNVLANPGQIQPRPLYNSLADFYRTQYPDTPGTPERPSNVLLELLKGMDKKK